MRNVLSAIRAVVIIAAAQEQKNVRNATHLIKKRNNHQANVDASQDLDTLILIKVNV
jgi:hypothetical protein